MMLCNQASHYDVAIAAIAGGAQTNTRVAVDAVPGWISIYMRMEKVRIVNLHATNI